jgi:hypothetical protein
VKTAVLLAAVLVALLSMGCGSTKTVTKTVTVVRTTASELQPPREVVLYGHIDSLTPKGQGFELRFDPAFLLTGATAQRAAVEDGVLEPGEAVPNDNYTRDESHRLLTYTVPSTASATVLINPGTGGIRSTAVPVSELARIIRGENPRRRALFGPVKSFGFWIRTRIDAVRSLDQQYRP